MKNLLFGLLILFVILLTKLSAESYITITVNPGDTLSKISKKYLNNVDKWKELLKFNNIDDPNKIFPGEKLKVPVSIAKKEILVVKPIVSANSSQAVAVFVKGKVWKDEKGKEEVNKGNILSENSEIITDNNSGTTIKFYDNSQLIIGAGSKVKLQQFWGKENKDKPGKIRLFFGKITAKIQHVINRSFSVFTPYAIGGVRGTIFRMSEKDGKTRLEVLKGKVALKAGDKEILVPAGYGSFTENGKVPDVPVKLPPIPLLTSPKNNSKLNVFKFSWNGEGEKYIFEIAEDKDFSKIIYADTITSAIFYPTKIVFNKGNYYWRVSAIANGYTGIPSNANLIIIK